MDFDLTDDQHALVTGIRELCDGHFPLERVQALADGAAFDADGWTALADAGVFSLRRPEAEGGVGLGMAEAALVFYELGAALVPGPLVATHLMGGRTTSAVLAPDTPVLLAHPDVVEQVLVLNPDGATVIERAAIETVPVADPLDPLTPLARVVALPQGEALTGAADLRRDGTVLTAALLAGIADAVTTRATVYAKEREQFGRPIGGFQAVKHLLADMFVRAEVARVAVLSAAVHVDQPDVGDVAQAVRSAKVLAGEAALANAKAAIQVHGGMGFTWEVPIHLYLKRAAVLDVAFGTAATHASALAAAL